MKKLSRSVILFYLSLHVVGGGPFAIEAVRLCVAGGKQVLNPNNSAPSKWCHSSGAKRVTVLIRRAHWVFPRTWFQSRALTRLFWRLCAGAGAASVHRRMALLCKVTRNTTYFILFYSLLTVYSFLTNHHLIGVKGKTLSRERDKKGYTHIKCCFGY